MSQAAFRPSTTPRVEAIQSLRAIAALLVLTTHAAVSVIEHGGGEGAFVAAIPGLARIGYSGVDLFFVISGFVMAHTLAEPRGVRQFLASRFMRIWPIYALATLAAMPLIDPVAIDPRTLVTTITLLPLLDGPTYHTPILTVGWTLGVEATFYFFVAAVIAVRGTTRTLLALTLLAALGGLVATAPWAPIRMILSPVFFEFGLGIMVWMAWRTGFSAGGHQAIAGGLLALGGCALGIIARGVDMDPALTAAGQNGLSRAIAWGLPWGLIVYGMVTRRGAIASPIGRAMRAVGDASYSLYLVHPTLIYAILVALPAPTPTNAHVWVVMLFLMSLLAGVVVHRNVERPLLAVLRQTFAGRRAAISHLTPVLAT